MDNEIQNRTPEWARGAIWPVPVATRTEIAAGYVVPVDPASDTGCESCE